MTHLTPRRSAVCVLLLAIAMTGCSASRVSDATHRCAGRTDSDRREECRSGGNWSPDWKEARTVLPAPPEARDLVPIEAPRGAPGYDYFIDRKSVTRGTDGVMRYTVVARSPSGVSNAFHEGLRCVDETVRTYAYAGNDGVFRPVSATDWSPIAIQGTHGYQDYLANVIMCDRQGFAWDAEKVVRALGAQYTSGGVRIERACKDLQRCGSYNRSD